MHFVSVSNYPLHLKELFRVSSVVAISSIFFNIFNLSFAIVITLSIYCTCGFKNTKIQKQKGRVSAGCGV